MYNQTGLVFIHGAGLNCSIWNEVQALIKVPSASLSFPQRFPDKGVDKSFDLEAYCRTLLQDIEEWNYHQEKDIEDYILVAHSIGGVVALKLIEQLGTKVKGFVCISALIPENGGSFISALPFFQRILMRIMLPLTGTRPPKSVIEKSLCNGLTEDQCKKVSNEYIPESVRLYFDKTNVPVPTDIKTLYIKLTDDKTIPVNIQERSIKNLNAGEVVSVQAGHLAMLSQPGRIAEIINKFVNSI